MTSKEAKNIIKSQFEQLGFQTKGNVCYKFVDEEYLVGVHLDHHPFRKAYFLECGGVYLPDERKTPFNGWFDYSTSFQFRVESGEQIKSCDFLEYEFKTENDVITEIQVNIEHLLRLYYDKSYISNQLKEDLNRIRKCAYQDLDKLISRAGLNKDAAYTAFHHQPDLNDLDKYLKNK